MDEMIRVRISTEDKERMEDAARAVGLGLSAWLRMLGLNEAKKQETKGRR